MSKEPLILALPKGRILKELLPVLERADIIPEPSFFDDDTRQLRFKTNRDNLDIIKVRSFDAVTFVTHGAASLAIAGSDVLEEFDSEHIYAPLDLGIGACRLSIAARNDHSDDYRHGGHIYVATKYPKTAKNFFESQSVQAECIKLNGAMELAPNLGLCDYIVDLVSTGSTLKANGLKEIETLAEVSSYLVVHRGDFKTRKDEIAPIIDALKEALA